MEGKGFGIIASKFIEKGTVILPEEDAQMPYIDEPADLKKVSESV